MSDWQPLTSSNRPKPGLPVVVLYQGAPYCAECQVSDEQDDEGLILHCDEAGLSWNLDLDAELPSHFFQLTNLPGVRVADKSQNRIVIA